jgi:dihydroxyacetone kinase-like predicted kinase
VEQGQIIALLDGKLVLSASSLPEACLSLLETAKAEDFELITLFYGSNVDRSEVDQIADAIKKAYPDQQVEILEGGQPYYQFIISIE